MKTRLTKIILLLLCFSLLPIFSGCSGEDADSAAEPGGETVGIIAALDFEVQTIQENLEDVTVEEIAGTSYYSGRIGNHQVICMQCGMGKVSAALGAQAMITRYHPDVIINTGCAGALSPELEVGDVVLADVTVEWDLDTIDLGNPRGYVSAMGQVEMHPDEALTNEIAAVIGDNARIYRGMIVSGDQFVSSPEQRSMILASFPEALCAEMEGAAVGHVCEQNGVAFCVIRCISDNANGDSGVDFAEFSVESSEKSAGYLLEFLRTY